MKTAKCPFCGKETDKFIMFRGDIVGCRFCGIQAKQTNADKLRAMTDEELAEWFVKIRDDIADYYDKGHSVAPELPIFTESWLDWLRQEATE